MGINLFPSFPAFAFLADVEGCRFRRRRCCYGDDERAPIAGESGSCWSYAYNSGGTGQ